MGEGLVFYETDDVTAQPTITFPTTASGSTSAATAGHFWNDKWSLTGASPWNVRLRLLGEISAGVWAEAGLPILDRREVEIRITGGSNPGMDPLFAVPDAGPWMPFGAGLLFTLGSMQPNTSIYLELRYSPKMQGGSGTITRSYRIEAIYDEWATPENAAIAGILTGCGEPSISEWALKPTVTESGTPDDKANVGAEWYVGRGIPRRSVGAAVTLNQNDGAAAALTVGNAYISLLSQPYAGGAIVTTKGAQAAAGSALAPALPASNLPIALVQVSYQAGASVITNADITVVADDGRAELTYSAGSLTVTVARLRALTGTTRIDRPSGNLALDPSVTTTIYLAADGSHSTTSGLPLWDVTTDGSGVTGVVDRRVYIETNALRITLKKTGTLATGTAVDMAVIPFPWALDRVSLVLGTAASGGATGSTTIDVNTRVAGVSTTIFTSQGGSPETRPTIASGSYSATGWPEVTSGAANTVLEFDIDAITAGGTTELNAFVTLIVYPASA